MPARLLANERSLTTVTSVSGRRPNTDLQRRTVSNIHCPHVFVFSTAPGRRSFKPRMPWTGYYPITFLHPTHQVLYHASRGHLPSLRRDWSPDTPRIRVTRKGARGRYAPARIGSASRGLWCCSVGYPECLLLAATGGLGSPALAVTAGFPPGSLPVLELRLILGHILLLRPGGCRLLLQWLAKLCLVGRLDDDYLGLLLYRRRLVHRTLPCHRLLHGKHCRRLLRMLWCWVPLPDHRLWRCTGFLLRSWFNRFIITAPRSRQ
jgi:hypothetical protein